MLDPILIFGMGWGIEGAAIASIARYVTLLIALHAVFGSRVARPTSMTWLREDLPAIIKVAGPGC